MNWENINIQADNLELTDDLKEYLREKLSHLERHFGKDPIAMDIELAKMSAHQTGPVYRCEINTQIPNVKNIMRAESTEEDIFAAIDTCIPKLKQQLDTHREKRETMFRKGARTVKEFMTRWRPPQE